MGIKTLFSEITSVKHIKSSYRPISLSCAQLRAHSENDTGSDMTQQERI